MIWYRRLLWSTTLLSPTLLSDSQVSISLVIHGLWWTVSGQVKAHVVLTYTNGVSPNFQWLCPATDYEWHCWHVPVNKIWRRTESTPRSGWWGSHMAGIYRDWSTREINNTIILCLQCFDPVGWAAGRASGLQKKLSGGVLAWLSVWSEVQTCIWPSWCHCHSLSLASVKSRLVLPFWYRLTRVVPGKGPLNGMYVCIY